MVQLLVTCSNQKCNQWETGLRTGLFIATDSVALRTPHEIELPIFFNLKGQGSFNFDTNITVYDEGKTSRLRQQGKL